MTDIIDSAEEIEQNSESTSQSESSSILANRQLVIGGIVVVVVVAVLLWRRQQSEASATASPSSGIDDAEGSDEEGEAIEVPVDPDSELEKDSAIVNSDVFDSVGS
jgi:hypothetical protein